MVSDWLDTLSAVFLAFVTSLTTSCLVSRLRMVVSSSTENSGLHTGAVFRVLTSCWMGKNRVVKVFWERLRAGEERDNRG